jgi:hypothetical protein
LDSIGFGACCSGGKWLAGVAGITYVESKSRGGSCAASAGAAGAASATGALEPGNLPGFYRDPVFSLEINTKVTAIDEKRESGQEAGACQ